jgi:hypothetical protein
VLRPHKNRDGTVKCFPTVTDQEEHFRLKHSTEHRSVEAQRNRTQQERQIVAVERQTELMERLLSRLVPGQEISPADEQAIQELATPAPVEEPVSPPTPPADIVVTDTTKRGDLLKLIKARGWTMPAGWPSWKQPEVLAFVRAHLAAEQAVE